MFKNTGVLRYTGVLMLPNKCEACAVRPCKIPCKYEPAMTAGPITLGTVVVLRLLMGIVQGYGIFSNSPALFINSDTVIDLQ